MKTAPLFNILEHWVIIYSDSKHLFTSNCSGLGLKIPIVINAARKANGASKQKIVR